MLIQNISKCGDPDIGSSDYGFTASTKLRLLGMLWMIAYQKGSKESIKGYSEIESQNYEKEGKI